MSPVMNLSGFPAGALPANQLLKIQRRTEIQETSVNGPPS